MKYLKQFESFSEDKILIIVDVQKSFKKFFNDKYLSELNKYCKEFNKVYQIWDNHSEDKKPDIDFQYEERPDIENKDDLYKWNNQTDIIEKRYNYDVDVDFYKKILDQNTFNNIKSKENNLKQGDSFKTTEGTIIVFIGNNHKWFHCPKKLYDLFLTLKGREVVMVGGADDECLEDLMVTAKILGVNLMENKRYIYSAKGCPIK